MIAPFVLGLDAGNTKTLAVIADSTGRVIGYGRSRQANIYVDFDGAVAALKEACQQAQEMSGLSCVHHIALSAAGADWPEDFTALHQAMKSAGLVQGDHELSVVNDAVGAVWSGSPSGEGVAVAVGTSAGIGARFGERLWHSSYWQEPEGAVHLGQQALRAVYRAELGLSQPTSLTKVILEHFQLTNVEELLHAFTARVSTLKTNDVAGLARLLLTEAQNGDACSHSIVTRHAEALGDYALVAARKVGLNQHAFPLVLTGGVLRHPGSLLKNTLLRRVQEQMPRASLQSPEFEPVGGAVCIALSVLGLHNVGARATLKNTLPPSSFFST